ncbi:hypothetical protein VXE65_19110, partial [Mycolicibacterium conceptionense]|uniref:hypothetical protein n=1 Tax=Mycolicibacterium conceptionense TaxID=451644 RepID=UPI003204CBA8
ITQQNGSNTMDTTTLAQSAIVITIIGVPAIFGCALYTVGIVTKIFRGAENRAFYLGYEAGHQGALDEATIDADTIQH